MREAGAVLSALAEFGQPRKMALKIVQLEAELEKTKAQLEAARAEVKRLTAAMQCG